MGAIRGMATVGVFFRHAMSSRFDKGLGCLLSLTYEPKGSQRREKMARRKTGNRKGQEAFKVLQEWRKYGTPEFITAYEAYHLTGGLVGKPASAQEMKLVEVAVAYIKKGGSFHDWKAIS